MFFFLSLLAFANANLSRLFACVQVVFYPVVVFVVVVHIVVVARGGSVPFIIHPVGVSRASVQSCIIMARTTDTVCHARCYMLPLLLLLAREDFHLKTYVFVPSNVCGRIDDMYIPRTGTSFCVCIASRIVSYCMHHLLRSDNTEHIHGE